MRNQEAQTILSPTQLEMTVKGRLRSIARGMSAWPVLGRFVRMLIAIIRLPEERMQYQRQLAQQARQLKDQTDALVLVHERLARYEFFIASQIPKLASSLAELRQVREKTEIMEVVSAQPASATTATSYLSPSKQHAVIEVKNASTV